MPQYKGKLVVENPATSSPGLAFLLATIVRFGETGDYTWQDYWRDLRANDVLVVPDWDNAYYTSSPAAPARATGRSSCPTPRAPRRRSYFADPQPGPRRPRATSTTAASARSSSRACSPAPRTRPRRQAFVDFLCRREFQEDIPLNMFVFPANPDAPGARPLHPVPGPGARIR